MTLTPQHLFHNTRQWRFDFAFLDIKIAIEIQGIGRGHQSIPSMMNDYSKHNEALRYGWITIYLMGYQLTPETIDDTIKYVLQIINDRRVGIITQPPPQKINQYSSLIEEARSKLINGQL